MKTIIGLPKKTLQYEMTFEGDDHPMIRFGETSQITGMPEWGYVDDSGTRYRIHDTEAMKCEREFNRVMNSLRELVKNEP